MRTRMKIRGTSEVKTSNLDVAGKMSDRLSWLYECHCCGLRRKIKESKSYYINETTQILC